VNTAYSSMTNPAHLRKGIVLAGGSVTRLYPITRAVNKQLFPTWRQTDDLLSPLQLRLGGTREVLIISIPQDLPAFRQRGSSGRGGVCGGEIEALVG
jgi:dTDP-glucose pyrophosphorylase